MRPAAQLDLPFRFDVDAALSRLADVRAQRAADSLPRTVEQCVQLLTQNTQRGTPGRSWETMTPSRYTHAADLLRAGCAPDIVTRAIDRINASAWLRMPAHRITDAHLELAALEAAKHPTGYH